ncbi:Ribonuclease h domain, partial [Thalictrum thalictroides]
MEPGPERNFLIETWNIYIKEVVPTVRYCQWRKPSQGKFALNTDGTLQAGRGGWAAVIRDSNGEVIAASKGASQHTTIAAIELQGLEQGLELATRHHIRHIQAQTDSTNVLSFLQPGHKPPWEMKHMLRRIKRK